MDGCTDSPNLYLLFANLAAAPAALWVFERLQRRADSLHGKDWGHPLLTTGKRRMTGVRYGLAAVGVYICTMWAILGSSAYQSLFRCY